MSYSGADGDCGLSGGEVSGPKGKVSNAVTTETGANISVDDDGMVGRVSIGSSDKGAVEEAKRQIQLILNPPTAEVGLNVMACMPIGRMVSGWLAVAPSSVALTVPA